MDYTDHYEVIFIVGAVMLTLAAIVAIVEHWQKIRSLFVRRPAQPRSGIRLYSVFRPNLFTLGIAFAVDTEVIHSSFARRRLSVFCLWWCAIIGWRSK